MGDTCTRAVFTQTSIQTSKLRRQAESKVPVFAAPCLSLPCIGREWGLSAWQLLSSGVKFAFGYSLLCQAPPKSPQRNNFHLGQARPLYNALCVQKAGAWLLVAALPLLILVQEVTFLVTPSLTAILKTAPSQVSFYGFFFSSDVYDQQTFLHVHFLCLLTLSTAPCTPQEYGWIHG